MTCQDCGLLLPVDQTIRADDVDTRIHTCACGSRWMSETRVVRRLSSTKPRAGTSSAPISTPLIPAGNPSAHKSDPPAGAQPPVATAGGVGGGLPSGLISDPDSHPSSLGNPDQTPARVKRRKDAETPAFVAFYTVYPRKEARPRAWSAWVAQGCEAIADQVMRGLTDWQPEFSRRTAKDPSTVPHPASWLNARQWQDAPPAPPKPKDTRCAFHLNWNNNGRKPPGGWYAECPECKHARAALTGRQGDAAPVRDLVAETEAKLAAQRGVKPASSDELAALRAERGQVRGSAEPRPPPPGVARSPLSPALPGGNSADGSGTPAGYPGVVSSTGSSA